MMKQRRRRAASSRRRVVGIGPAPSGLPTSVEWERAPFENGTATDADDVVAWLRTAAERGTEAFVVPMAVAEWLVDQPDVASALVEAFPLTTERRVDGVAFDLLTAREVVADARIDDEGGVDDPETGEAAIGTADDDGDIASGDGAFAAGGRDSEPAVRAKVKGWSVDPAHPTVLRAAEDLVDPKVKLTLRDPVGGAVRGGLTLVVRGIDALHVRLPLARGVAADVYVDTRDPSYLHHTLDFLDLAADPATGVVVVEFDLAMDRWEHLSAISIAPAEPRNWRLHPGFKGGDSIRLKPVVPAGASLEIVDVAVAQIDEVRRSPRWAPATRTTPRPHRKPVGRLRDAVVFSSWVPESGLPLAAYFLEMLKRRHADSKIFLGINHGSASGWRKMAESSGLDVVVRDAPPGVAISSDVAGTIAGLAALRDCEEPFDVVWFGHTKGISKLDQLDYGLARWAVERWFWDARAEADAIFADPTIGVWAPHWLMCQPEHLEQTDALRRMYDAPCAPLGAMAVSTHFAMRYACVRDFVDRVHPKFFFDGPDAFGGSRFFAEFALPNVAVVQGYEPFVGDGVGGTHGPAERGAERAIMNDWRQNNGMVRHELARWREDPVGFEAYAVEHTVVP